MNLSLIDIFYSISPVFVLIVLGNLLRRNGIPSDSFWGLNDKLVYWILMPSLLFNQLSQTNFTPNIFTNYTMVILSGFIVVILLSIIISKLFGYTTDVSSSIMQGAARHNGFVALAIVSSLFGAEAIALGVIIMAILIPVANIVIVAIMVTQLQDKKTRKSKSVLIDIFIDLAKNPILVSVLIGLVFSLMEMRNIPIIHKTTNLLGSAALPIMLLSVGANIKLKQLKVKIIPAIISIILKLAIFPFVVYLVANYLRLSQLEVVVAVIFASVPTAVSSFALARQLGGETKLMARIISIQVALSFITIPLILVLIV